MFGQSALAHLQPDPTGLRVAQFDGDGLELADPDEAALGEAIARARERHDIHQLTPMVVAGRAG